MSEFKPMGTYSYFQGHFQSDIIICSGIIICLKLHIYLFKDRAYLVYHLKNIIQ